jgi:hypothetical protein
VSIFEHPEAKFDSRGVLAYSPRGFVRVISARFHSFIDRAHTGDRTRPAAIRSRSLMDITSKLCAFCSERTDAKLVTFRL